MTAGAEARQRDGARGRFRAGLAGLGKLVLAVALCLNPLTAIIMLGWLTRKTRADIDARLGGQPLPRWPNLIVGEHGTDRGFAGRWFGGIGGNVAAGLKAWLGALVLTAPFSLVWFAAWTAGWENSFNKGYENAGLWPGTGLVAVLLSLPAWTLLPMAIAHQARTGQVLAVLDLPKIWRLVRASGFSYFGLTLLVAIGGIGVFGARALPVFAEHLSPELAGGSAEAFNAFSGRFTLIATVPLILWLVAIRNVMARVYANAQRCLEGGQRGRLITAVPVALLCGSIWLGLVFLIHVGQFLNYHWWGWLNQPVVMLPWLGVVR